MTDRPTEYQVLKRLLYYRKDIDPDLTGSDVNTIIQEANEAAYNKLDRHDQRLVRMAQNKLMATIDSRFGEKGALELLAAIALYLESEE